MNVAIKEVESKAELKDPKAVFQDDNLTVYAIPVRSQAKGKGKRKRTPSPDTASKRPHPPGSPPPTVDEPVQPELSDILTWQNFNPTRLVGQTAQEWRYLILRNMFPGVPPPPPPPNPTSSKKGKRAKQDKTTDANIDAGPSASEKELASSEDAWTMGQPEAIAERDRKLPRLSIPEDERDSTLCYVCVGPAFRGKFRKEKAQELEVPEGPLWGKLTRGETVTFMVDDLIGRKQKRTVSPEQCMDMPESPKVCAVSLHADVSSDQAHNRW